MTGVVEKSRRIARRGLVVLSVTATMAISGVAFANWTLAGAGDGSATAGTVSNITGADLTVVGSLYPGATLDATIEISNENRFPIRITDVEFSGSVSVSDGIVGCDVTFNNQDNLELDVAAGSPEEPLVAVVTLTGAVTMGPGAANACQGQTFTETFDLTAQSNASS